MEALAFVGLGAGLVPLALILLLVVAVTGGRNEPDPATERPAAIYYAGVMFVALFTALFAVFTVAASLLNLTTDEESFSGFSSRTSVSIGAQGQEIDSPPRSPVFRQGSDDSENNGDYAAALRGLIIAAAAGGLYVFHDRRRRKCRVGPVGGRVKKTYLYTVSFTSVFIALVAAVVALYGIVELIAPGVTSAGSRGDVGVELGQSGFLTLAAAALFFLHLRAAEQPDADEAAIGIAPVAPPEPRRRRPLRPDDS